MGTIWDPDCLSLAFGIGFRMRDGDDEAFLRKTDVLIAQTDQLSAAEGAREADEQERAVAGGSQIVWHSGKHLPQQFGRKRLFSLLRGPLHAPDAGHDGANELVLDRIGKAGKLVRLADGGQMPLDGPGFETGCRFRRVSGDRRGSRRQAATSLPLQEDSNERQSDR